MPTKKNQTKNQTKNPTKNPNKKASSTPVRIKISTRPEDSLGVQCGYCVRPKGVDIPASKRQRRLKLCLVRGRFTYKHMVGKLSALRTLTKNRHPDLNRLYDADVKFVQAFVRERRRSDPQCFKH